MSRPKSARPAVGLALSHKGRYWQISGLEKQVGLRAIIYISAPAGECSKGRFRALFCGAKRSERTPVSDAPSPPVPFFLALPEGAGGTPGSRLAERHLVRPERLLEACPNPPFYFIGASAGLTYVMPAGSVILPWMSPPSSPVQTQCLPPASSAKK